MHFNPHTFRLHGGFSAPDANQLLGGTAFASAARGSYYATLAPFTPSTGTGAAYSVLGVAGGSSATRADIAVGNPSEPAMLIYDADGEFVTFALVQVSDLSGDRRAVPSFDVDGVLLRLATPFDVSYGGTGATNATDARANLGLAIGSDVQAYDADLAALAGLSATAGMLSRTGAGAFAVRTLTAPAAGITISNGTGAAGNPTLALANDLAALEGLSGTNTIYYRSGADTWSAVTIGSGLSFSGGTLSATSAGTVTSVGLSLPSILTVSGSPVTTSGTLTASLATQSANRVFAGPTSGGATTPTFRALVSADLPTHTHSAADVTSGTLTLARGGTGADLSATGPGVLRQATAGAVFTAGQALDYILLRDEKTAGTEGGSNTGGTTQTRALTTEVVDTGGHCTLSSNQFTLSAGTYRIRARVPAYRVGRHQARLQNISAASLVIAGTSAYSENANNVMGWSYIEGRFTIGSTQTFEVQHYTTTSVTSQGFGVYGDSGLTAVYTVVELWREIG